VTFSCKSDSQFVTDSQISNIISQQFITQTANDVLTQISELSNFYQTQLNSSQETNFFSQNDYDNHFIENNTNSIEIEDEEVYSLELETSIIPLELQSQIDDIEYIESNHQLQTQFLTQFYSNQFQNHESSSQLSFQSQQQFQEVPSQNPLDFEPLEIQVCETADYTSYPIVIKQIYSKIRENHSDCSFVHFLANQMSSNIVPFGSFMNFRIALLLSLASISEDCKPIHIVAIGTDTTIMNSIMSEFRFFADRFIFLSINEKFDMEISNGNGIVEAGSLTLAKNGVFNIGDWSILTLKNSAKVLQYIQSVKSRVIWTYWSMTNDLGKDSTNFNQFISSFGIPIIADDNQNKIAIHEFIFESFKTENSENSISKHDLKEFISLVSCINVKFSDEATELMENYFKAIRIIHECSLESRSFEILKEFARSHAKLCMRKIVTKIDCLAAINITENVMKTLFSSGSFTSPFEPEFESLTAVDNHYGKMSEWLENLIENVLNR
jgi:hypothetical protein